MRCLSQHRLDLWAAVTVHTVSAPRRNDSIGPIGAIPDRRVIVWANRISGGPHIARIGVAPRKDIRHPKSTKPKRPRAPLATLNSWVVLDFGSSGRIEHNKQGAFASVIPDPRERIAIAFTIRIDRGGSGQKCVVGACDHMRTLCKGMMG